MGVDEYNLIDRPCILVGLNDGSTRELSLSETFARASDIAELRGSPETLVFVQFRLLEAILRRALVFDGRLGEGTAPVDTWRELWEADALPTDVISGYLAAHWDRFDLIHPTTPFMQVATLHTSKGDAGSGLGRLLLDSTEDGLFSMRRAEGIARLDYGEAARALLQIHAYGVSGIHPAGIDETGPDPRAKGGKIYPLGTGPAGDLGGVMIEGDNLRETLLLNLVLGASADEPFAGELDDKPVWEREQLTVAVEPRDIPGPHGQADLFTWQARRVRLLHDGNSVTAAVVCYGDQLRPQNLHTVETMSAYRHSVNQSKLLGGTVYMPVRHQPSRSFWRGLGALLPHEASAEQTAISPRTIRWLRHLSYSDVLDGHRVLRTRAIGVEYGTQSSVITELYSDAVDIQIALLQDRGQALVGVALEMVSRTEDAVRGLGRLAENLVIAAGGDPLDAAKAARDAEQSQGYALVDAPFRRWLRRLGDDTQVEEARTAWVRCARGLLRTHAQHLVRNAGVAAWRGRPRGTGSDEIVNAPKAFIWFDRQLGKALPRVDDDRHGASDTRGIEEESA